MSRKTRSTDMIGFRVPFAERIGVLDKNDVIEWRPN